MKINIPSELRSVLSEYVKTLGLNVKSIGYDYKSGIANVRFMDEPTVEQVSLINQRVPILIRNYTYRDIDNYDDILKDLTPIELEKYIKNNVVDLVSARSYIIRLSKAVLYLHKRLIDNGLS